MRLTKSASAEQAISAAVQLLSADRPREAVALLLPQLETVPADYWVNVHLGTAYARLGEADAARERFLAALASDPPEPFAAICALVRQDFRQGRFDREALLDEALALPGELDTRFPAVSQKQSFHAQTRFLRALAALRRGRWEEAEHDLADAYAVSRLADERSFAFGWALDLLRAAPDLTPFPHLDYVRQVFLRLGMADSLRYEQILAGIGGEVSVVEIGGMDGVRFDPLYANIVEKRWTSVIVEPLPDIFAMLTTNYAALPWVTCANVAITDATGPLTMFRIDPKVVEGGAPDWLLGISSAFMGPDLTYFEGAVKQEVVRGLTFADFVDEFDVKRIDVLQTDTEGYDWRVLKQVDLARWNIGLIHSELIHIPPPERLEVFRALRGAGYDYTYDGMDITAVKIGAMADLGQSRA